MKQTLPEYLQWLSFRLHIRPCPPTKVVCFDICFQNQSSRTQELEFANAARSAERVGLIFLDEQRRRVEPFVEIYGKPGPVPERERLHQIPPGATWTYTLEGKYSNGELHFGGAAAYKLTQGASYSVGFRYCWVMSPLVSWRPTE